MYELTDLDIRSLNLLGDKAVLKSLVSGTTLGRLPRYVSEYLIGKFVRKDHQKDDLAKLSNKIRELIPDNDSRELLKSKLLSKGEVVIIDNIEARIDLRNGRRYVHVPALADDKVRVSQSVLDANPALLSGGSWGTLRIKYSPECDRPNELIGFTSFQVGSPDLDHYKKIRKNFSLSDWCDLLLQSAGYQGGFSNRVKWLLLARMLPLVEKNVNLLELGPRQTGKTFLLRNLSPKTFTISGGRTTPANLFANLSTKQVGVLGNRKVVIFDEIAHTVFDKDETISTLKDYMESGQYSRGSVSYASDCGIVLTGNIDVEGTRPHSRYKHLLEPLPEELIDSAFHDRIHGYIPGWEIPKISQTAQGAGFITDYFGEVLVRLREESFIEAVREVPQYPTTRRDQVAVERISSGMLKLLYPHGEWTNSELCDVVSFASELRQRVHNQLCSIAGGEFKPKQINPLNRSHSAYDQVDFSR